MNFNAYASYYDLLYKDKDYSSESNYVLQMLREVNPDCTHILELGAGSGSHAEHLCRQNCHITGIERSEAMVEKAGRKNIENFTIQQGDITNFNIDKNFDAAISLFHVISYLKTNDQLVQCFKNTHRHLKPGGLFLFDIWYTPAVYTLKPETRIKRLSGNGVSVTRIAEPEIHYNENVVEVNYEVIVKDDKTGQAQYIQEQHPMRHFSLPEIGLLAAHTGFSLVKAEEFLTGNAPGNNTWGVCILLQKN